MVGHISHMKELKSNMVGHIYSYMIEHKESYMVEHIYSHMIEHKESNMVEHIIVI